MLPITSRPSSPRAGLGLPGPLPAQETPGSPGPRSPSPHPLRGALPSRPGTPTPPDSPLASRRTQLGTSSSTERLQALLRHQADEAMDDAARAMDTDSDSDMELDIVIDDSAIQAARQARIAELTQALAGAHTTEALNAMVEQAMQTAWQAAECATVPTGQDISGALIPTFDNRHNGFMDASQAVVRLEAAANAWDAAVEHYGATLSARDLLLPHAGPDLLDLQLQHFQTMACRLRAQEKTLRGLLLLLQCFRVGAAGQSRVQDEAADHLREARALRAQEPLDALPPGLADIDQALRQALARVGKSIQGDLEQIQQSGKPHHAPATLAPPGSDASRPTSIEEAWIAHVAQSGTALEEAARALLAAWGHPPQAPALAAPVAEALTDLPALQDRATQRREAALHQAMEPLMMAVEEMQARAAARQDTAPDMPWRHTLDVFHDLNLALQCADDFSRMLDARAAQWTPAQRETSRETLDGLQARIAPAREQASAQARAALHQSLDSFIQRGIGLLRIAHAGPEDMQAAVRQALPEMASTARSTLAWLEQSGVHPRLAPLSLEQCAQVCTAIAQACEDMVHVPGTPAEAVEHAARLQATERQVRQAGQGELAPAMRPLADLCGAARMEALEKAIALEIEAVNALDQTEWSGINTAMERVGTLLSSAHAIGFGLPLQTGPSGLQAAGTGASSSASAMDATTSEDAALAATVRATARRAREMRQASVELPRDTPPQLAQIHRETLAAISEILFAAEATDTLLTVFQDASAALAAASAADRPTLAAGFADRARLSSAHAVDALSDQLAASAGFSSKKARHQLDDTGANNRYTERTAAQAELSLRALGLIFEGQKKALEMHAQQRLEHHELRDAMLAIRKPYGEALTAIETGIQRLEDNLATERTASGDTQGTDAELSSIKASLERLSWRAGKEMDITIGQLTVDWLERFIGNPRASTSHGRQLIGGMEMVDYYTNLLEGHKQDLRAKLGDDATKNEARPFFAACLRVMQQLSDLEKKIKPQMAEFATRYIADAAAKAEERKTSQPTGKARGRKRR
ncbi:septation ring formation regulator EzrA [Acidovorax sp. NCPPB 2350]|nr:septation ring formation regulator EzrA [Acidovorax sp. NCPPB 2350]